MFINPNRAFAAIDEALALDSFPTKSAQKDALSCCQQALDYLHRWVQETLLSNKDEDNNFIAPNGNDQYYWHAGCHKWNDKVEAMFSDQPEFVAAARIIVGKYLTIKAMPVVAPTPAQAVERKIERYVGDFLKKREAQINEQVRLIDLFKRLNVSASSHYVTNQYGTTFVRYAYYLNGARTALAVIMASVDKAERDGIIKIVDGYAEFTAGA